MKVQGSVQFDIYGLIQEPTYWADCLNLIAKLPSTIQVNYCGECDPDKVINTLKNYGLFFLPTLNENYGYVIAESLAAGTPVLLSNQTPWDDLPDKKAGWEFDLSQPSKFSAKIDELILLDDAAYSIYKQSALDYFLENIQNDNLAEKYKLFFNGKIV